MADMASFDEQMPCVGIFWYDPQKHSFFGVHKKEISPRMEQEFSLPYFEFVYAECPPIELGGTASA